MSQLCMNVSLVTSMLYKTLLWIVKIWIYVGDLGYSDKVQCTLMPRCSLFSLELSLLSLAI